VEPPLVGDTKAPGTIGSFIGFGRGCPLRIDVSDAQFACENRVVTRCSPVTRSSTKK